ncbi:hypothetical protein BDP81DRAFT_171024 [Colletotrichum phormii]|uniref:Uncharacterized protein n=1 Tax=Colletotrichum phormii TaxID=359342 RepID=A0AAJ0E9L1_9PEZI|nr:uncharacterized protein BDP81DRAFT_171024 [Colletotrichum phormii]KAK1621812.1 hypothetical protein BDP81DRAFT_171024 [Colletotrichum phormii]
MVPPDLWPSKPDNISPLVSSCQQSLYHLTLPTFCRNRRAATAPLTDHIFLPALHHQLSENQPQEAADDAATDVGRSLLHRAPDVLVQKQAGRVSDPSKTGRLKTSTASLVCLRGCGRVGTATACRTALHTLTHTPQCVRVLCIHVSFRCLRMSHQCFPFKPFTVPPSRFLIRLSFRLGGPCLGLVHVSCQPHPSPPHLSNLRNGPLIHDGEEAFPCRQQTRERSLLEVKPRGRRDEPLIV